MKTHPMFKTGALILVALALAAASALAYYPSNPYSGVNTIGSAWQQTSTHYFYSDYAVGWHPTPGYVSAPRAGGSFGTPFLIGLRAPYYAPTPVTHYTQYSVNACVWPHCHLGAAGYGRMQTSQFANTGSYGGVFA